MKDDFYDDHFDDVHRVLRNRLGLTNPAALEIAIADLSQARLVELNSSPVKGKFDIPHIRAIHRYIFQDVFPWAGEFRNVTTARTNSFSFPPPIYIASSLETIFLNICNESYLKNLSPDDFAIRAGHYLGEINAVHPFREGNGRTQREFIRTLALHAGHRLSWIGLEPEENNSTSRISYATGDSSGLAALIRKRLS